jgi:hypothetical protein
MSYIQKHCSDFTFKPYDPGKLPSYNENTQVQKQQNIFDFQYSTLPSHVSTQSHIASNGSKIYNAACRFTDTLHKSYLITVHSFELGAFKNLLMSAATLSGLLRCRW